MNELKHIEAFGELTPAGERLLADGVERKTVRASAIVLHKGQPVSGAYIVLSGRLRVFTISPRGAEATLYFVGPGETCVIALNTLFGNLLYPAWVQAQSDTRLVVIAGAVYRRLFDLERGVRELTLRSQSTLVYRLMEELEHVHSANYRQRVAQFVLMHADADGVLRATQSQLAGHLGTTREVVARVVGELVERGLLRTGRGTLAISDLFGLRRIVAPERRAAGSRSTQRARGRQN